MLLIALFTLIQWTHDGLGPGLDDHGINQFNGAPSYKAYSEGSGMMSLPENPTVLQVKHELSHYLDVKKYGFDAYKNMSPAMREQLVLERLQQNRVWNELNQAEKEFSIDYPKNYDNYVKSYKK